jgi:hypothetical protein
MSRDNSPGALAGQAEPAAHSRAAGQRRRLRAGWRLAVRAGREASVHHRALLGDHASDLIGQLIESGRDILAEVDADPATVGKALSTVRDERAGLVLGLVHEGQFTLGITEDPTVVAGDRLLIAEATPVGHRR